MSTTLAKPKAAEVSADANRDAAPEAEAPKADGPKPMKKYDVGRKMGAFKRKLSAYTRVKARSLAALNGETGDKAAEASDAKAADADAEKKPVSKVLECYRLIRNFCLTYNWLQIEGAREESLLKIPDAFEADFKSLLTEENLKKFLAAMEG